ncbi:MAG: 5'-methylthioadenosine phosphorylase [Candidatus Adiutrix sp.]|nr:5'-methylthioadenosine phosphorylase [Candidatus Adiutrix sp.]
MNPELGLIVSDVCQLEDHFKSAPVREVEGEYGRAGLKIVGRWAVICRSGFDGDYILPHQYNTGAYLAAFQVLGLTEVVGVHSSGSLRPSLGPGTLVIPDDWISFSPPRHTLISGQRRHLTPAFSRRVRHRLADAAWQAGIRFENGGIYWQSPGPRLETKAEIKVMSNFADLAGMGLADEASLAQELGLEYGAVCSVDNYANGLGAPGLSDEMIRAQSAKSVAVISRLLECYASLPREG